MNDNPVISLPVSADLSTYSHVAVRLTSTGIALAGAGDLVIGTMIRGNSAAANVGDAVIGRSAAVKLWKANGLNNVTLANNTAAIAMGDALAQSSNGTYLRNPTLTIASGTAASGSLAITGHGLVVGDPVQLRTQTGATAGITLGVTYWVITVTDANNVIISATKGGAANTWTTNISAGTLQKMSDPAGNIILAVDSAPATSTDGIIRALCL